MRRSEVFEDLEMARLEAISVVRSMVERYREDGEVVLATEVVDELFVTRPDLVQRLAYPPARRFWVSFDRSWVLPRVFRGCDEFGNDTLAFSVGPAVVVLATTFPLRKQVQSAPMTSEEIEGPDWRGRDD